VFPEAYYLLTESIYYTVLGECKYDSGKARQTTMAVLAGLTVAKGALSIQT